MTLLRDDNLSPGTLGGAAGQSDFAGRAFRYERGRGLRGVVLSPLGSPFLPIRIAYFG
jgi:hypothetical protein